METLSVTPRSKSEPRQGLRRIGQMKIVSSLLNRSEDLTPDQLKEGQGVSCLGEHKRAALSEEAGTVDCHGLLRIQR